MSEVVEIVNEELLVISSDSVEVVSVAEQGPPGPPGDSAGQNLSIGTQNPNFPTGQSGLWVQTGLGVGGADFTIWIEDGQ